MENTRELVLKMAEIIDQKGALDIQTLPSLTTTS